MRANHAVCSDLWSHALLHLPFPGLVTSNPNQPKLIWTYLLPKSRVQGLRPGSTLCCLKCQETDKLKKLNRSLRDWPETPGPSSSVGNHIFTNLQLWTLTCPTVYGPSKAPSVKGSFLLMPSAILTCFFFYYFVCHLSAHHLHQLEVRAVPFLFTLEPGI